ncbi:MAG TPA: hypothetical protein VI386_17725 [Candidatus Sulfotelmatobacter sp.]
MKTKLRTGFTAYVAVVHKMWDRSGRHDGDWASFIDKNKKEAIKSAIRARSKWEAKGYGPYQIWVGTLTQAVNVPEQFELEAINDSLSCKNTFGDLYRSQQ